MGGPASLRANGRSARGGGASQGQPGAGRARPLSESASVPSERARSPHRWRSRYGPARPRAPRRSSTGLEPGGRDWTKAEGQAGGRGGSWVSRGPREPEPGGPGLGAGSRGPTQSAPPGAPCARSRNRMSLRGEQRSCRPIPTASTFGLAYRPSCPRHRPRSRERADKFVFTLRASRGRVRGRSGSPHFQSQERGWALLRPQICSLFLTTRPHLSTLCDSRLACTHLGPWALEWGA